MNSSFPNRWSFSYLKFTKYVTNIIAEPKYKYGQQEQVTVRNHNRSTALLKYWGWGWGGGLNRFYGYPTSPSASVMAQNIQLFGPHEGFLSLLSLCYKVYTMLIFLFQKIPPFSPETHMYELVISLSLTVSEFP